MANNGLPNTSILSSQAAIKILKEQLICSHDPKGGNERCRRAVLWLSATTKSFLGKGHFGCLHNPGSVSAAATAPLTRPHLHILWATRNTYS